MCYINKIALPCLSAVSLTVNPNRTQHFIKTSVSLSCEEKGNSTGWRLMRYTEKGMEDLVESKWVTKSGSTQTQDSGVYWCESGSGENSNAVNITVTGGDVILETPVHPVTEGDTVTLVCKHRINISNIIKADFYKDGVLIRNETTGEMTIPVVSKSDEGFYKCKSNEGESPGSWVTLIGKKMIIITIRKVLSQLYTVHLQQCFPVLVLWAQRGACFGLCPSTHTPVSNERPDDRLIVNQVCKRLGNI
uniref:Ig-like domain-containing protein n=1 Tax=Esox lucius TaxID=8010 RepID=A0A3P8Y647_ESOLU